MAENQQHTFVRLLALLNALVTVISNVNALECYFCAGLDNSCYKPNSITPIVTYYDYCISKAEPTIMPNGEHEVSRVNGISCIVVLKHEIFKIYGSK